MSDLVKAKLVESNYTSTHLTGALRIMWLVCAFDLPVDSQAARKRYTRFRTMLLNEGFTMVQNSLYSRHFPCLSDAKRAASRFGSFVPEDGIVDFYFITDAQMGITMSFYGKKTRHETAYTAPQQAELF